LQGGYSPYPPDGRAGNPLPCREDIHPSRPCWTEYSNVDSAVRGALHLYTFRRGSAGLLFARGLFSLPSTSTHWPPWQSYCKGPFLHSLPLPPFGPRSRGRLGPLCDCGPTSFGPRSRGRLGPLCDCGPTLRPLSLRLGPASLPFKRTVYFYYL